MFGDKENKFNPTRENFRIAALENDLGERDNVATRHPDQVKTMESLLASWKN
jgi:hypothetical protein